VYKEVEQAFRTYRQQDAAYRKGGCILQAHSPCYRVSGTLLAGTASGGRSLTLLGTESLGKKKKLSVPSSVSDRSSQQKQGEAPAKKKRSVLWGGSALKRLWKNHMLACW